MQIVLVSGDAGTGKTAFADRVSQHLTGEGWTVTAWRRPPADEGTPAGDRDPAEARFRQHQAVVGYLAAASRATPLLLVLDDLHRVDGETLALLADVTADLAAARLLVLATYRPAEASEQLSRYLAALTLREPVRVNLAGLDAVAAGALIPATYSGPADEQTDRTIAERAGVPGTPGAWHRVRRRGRHGQTRQPEAGWVPTAERFRDPPTGVIMRVWVDPSDESRHYVPDA